MKRVFIFLFSVLCIGTATGQTTVSEASIGDIGTKIYQATDETPDSTITITNGGIGLLWNFYALSVDILDSAYFADPANTPNAADYPAANLAIVEGNGNTTYIYKDTTGLYGEGQINDFLNTGDPLAFTFTPSLTLIEFIAAYGDTFSSWGTGQRTILDPFGSNDSIRITQSATTVSEIDGRGILITPLDTFDVIRQALAETTMFKVEIGGGTTWLTFLDDTLVNHRHVWWTDDTTARYSLVSISYDFFSKNITEVIWLSDYPTTPANNHPIAVIDVVTVDEDVPTHIDVQVNDFDVDGDAFSTTIISGGMNGTATLSYADSIEYTSNLNFNGDDTLIYEICDGGGLCDANIVIITVSPVNDKPVAVDDDGHFASPGGSIEITVQANDQDVDGDVLTTSLVTMPASGTATVLNGDSIEYTAGSGSGAVSFDYAVCDTGDLCDTATVNIMVAPVGLSTVIANDLSFYPNPTTGVVVLDGNGLVEVIDHFGRVVMNSELRENRLDLNGLADGLYMIRLRDGSSIRSGRIMLIR